MHFQAECTLVYMDNCKWNAQVKQKSAILQMANTVVHASVHLTMT